MNSIQTFTVNNITIDYLSVSNNNNNNNYIVCFLDNINDSVLNYINKLFNIIYPNFYYKKLYSYSNTCGDNATNICNELRNNYHMKTGKIIIYKWSNYTEDDLNILKKIFGYVREQIGRQYHALVYIEVEIENSLYYIAIETTVDNPYKLQFYVGNNRKDLDVILSARYLCDKYIITYDCDIFYTDLITKELKKGGKRKKVSKKRRYRNSKKYRNKTKRYRK